MKSSVSFLSEVLKGSPQKMSVNDNVNALTEQIRQITAMFQASELKRVELEKRVETMTDRPSLEETNRSIQTGSAECDEPDIEPTITSGEHIQLESYKAIPEFSGKQHEYRSWRNQVNRRMTIIKKFKAHPKYDAALAIIRAKITGAAADQLTNNKTPYNITCILKTLDAAYTDRRPLYAIEAEMVSIKQNNKNLHEYFNAINFALNAMISKIVLTYPTANEQQPLIYEAQRKAIRTFIVGLKFRVMRHILYGQQPQTLAESYTIAQTVFFDNEQLQLEQYPDANGTNGRYGNKTRTEWNQPRYNNTRNAAGQGYPPRNECYQSMNINNYDNRQPMNMDNENRKKQTNWRQPEPQQRMEYKSPRQRLEQPHTMQRINNLTEIDPPTPDEFISNNETETDDSAQNDDSSAFLDE